MSRPAARGRARQSSPTLKSLARLFRALSDESRLIILTLLNERGELSVGAIGRELGQSQPAVSHHLLQLRTAKLIEYRRDGKFNYYRLDDSGIQAAFHELNRDDGGKLLFASLEVTAKRKS